MHAWRRELAQQVADSCSSLRKLYKLRVACIVGGSDRAAQARSLAGRPDFIVATPGRLIDLADSASSALSEKDHLATHMPERASTSHTHASGQASCNHPRQTQWCLIHCSQ